MTTTTNLTPFHVSSTGELGSAAAEFDRLCAEREHLASFQKRLDFLARKAEEESK